MKTVAVDKLNRKLIEAWLIEIERYHGPFLRYNRNAVNAVADVCNMLGVYYLYNKFKVRKVICLMSCVRE